MPLPWYAWAAMGAAGVAVLKAGVADAEALLPAQPHARVRPGHAPNDPTNYSTTGLVLYPGPATNGNTTVDSAGHSHVHRTPHGPRYKVVQTPPRAGSFCDWVTAMRALLTAQGITGTRANFIITHWDRETGSGRYLWNNSFGNEKQYDAYRPNGPWHRLTDGEAYRTYLTASEGVAGNLGVLRSIGSGRAWAKLMAGDPTWYGQLGLDRYYGDRDDAPGIARAATHGQAEFDELLPRVAACP